MKSKIFLLTACLSFLPCFGDETTKHTEENFKPQKKAFKTPYKKKIKYFKSPYKRKSPESGASGEVLTETGRVNKGRIVKQFEVNQMKQTKNLPSLNNNNIKAFLDLISFAEGNTTYKTHYGFKNKLFNPRKEFPCKRVRVWGITSSACGKFMIMDFTYWRLKEKMGIKGFSPRNQDLMAIELIKEAGAYDDILRGDIEKAIIKCSGVWASFDAGNGKSYYSGQGCRKMKTLLRVYRKILKNMK